MVSVVMVFRFYYCWVLHINLDELYKTASTHVVPCLHTILLSIILLENISSITITYLFQYYWNVSTLFYRFKGETYQ